jgi:hypothetical protein
MHYYSLCPAIPQGTTHSTREYFWLSPNLQVIWFTKDKLITGVKALIDHLPDEKKGLVVLVTRDESLEEQFLDVQHELAMQAIRIIPVDNESCVSRMVSKLLKVKQSSGGAKVEAISFNKRVHTALKDSGLQCCFIRACVLLTLSLAPPPQRMCKAAEDRQATTALQMYVALSPFVHFVR